MPNAIELLTKIKEIEIMEQIKRDEIINIYTTLIITKGWLGN